MAHPDEIYGLIGFPLGHSWSASYFNEKFLKEGQPQKRYNLFPLASLVEFPALIHNQPSLAGLNVTIPYKEKIIPYLDELDPVAMEIGAVNTIMISRKNGSVRTKGFNTDAGGFYLTLKDQVNDCKALILGTGGAAKSVAHALNKLAISYTFVSRKAKGPGIYSYNELNVEIINYNKLIINTSPLGMYPDVTTFPPIPYHALGQDHFLYDLIYNPEETLFLKKGKAMHARTMNGQQMLVNQAELAYEIFQSTWSPSL